MRETSGFEEFYAEDRCVYKKYHSRKGFMAPQVWFCDSIKKCNGLRNEYPYLRVLTNQLENYV